MTRDDTAALRLAFTHWAGVLVAAAAARAAAEIVRTNGDRISAALIARHMDRFRLALINALAAVTSVRAG